MNKPRYCPDCSGYLVYELNLAKCEFGCGKVWDVSVLSATPRDKGLAREKKLRVVFTLAGAIIGLMIVRSFMFDQIEELGWRMFWRSSPESVASPVLMRSDGDGVSRWLAGL